VFSRPGKIGEMVDKRFICQSSAIEFLSKNGFDFNKLFYEGIPYLTVEEEAVVKAKMEPVEDKQEIPITESCQKFVEETMAKVSDWLQNSSEKVLVLPPCNSMFRRLIYQEVGKK
jgi:poly(A)-specific ribonuclease